MRQTPEHLAKTMRCLRKKAPRTSHTQALANRKGSGPVIQAHILAKEATSTNCEAFWERRKGVIAL